MESKKRRERTREGAYHSYGLARETQNQDLTAGFKLSSIHHKHQHQPQSTLSKPNSKETRKAHKGRGISKVDVRGSGNGMRNEVE